MSSTSRIKFVFAALTAAVAMGCSRAVPSDPILDGWIVQDVCDAKWVSDEDVNGIVKGEIVARRKDPDPSPYRCLFVAASGASQRVVVTFSPAGGESALAIWAQGGALTPRVANVGDDAVWIGIEHELKARKGDWQCDIHPHGELDATFMKMPIDAQARKLGLICNKLFNAS